MHARFLWWSLRHRRGRHVSNALAMAVTVAVVTVFVSVLIELVGFVRDTNTHGARILVTPKISAPGTTLDNMPMTFYQLIQSIEGVKTVQRRFVIQGRHPSGATYVVFGEELSGIELNNDFFPVTQDVIDAWKKNRIAAIVTETTARELNLKVGSTAEVTSGFGPLRIEVVGISKGALIRQSIAIHFEYMQEYTKIRDRCGYRVFTAPEDFERVTDEINERTRNTTMPAQALSTSAFRQQGAKRGAAIPMVLGFLGMFLIFTTALTLANNSAISIRERRAEAATLRVIGYRRQTIVTMFVIEAVFVGVIGGVVAIATMTLLFRNGVSLGAAGLFQASGLFQTVKIGGLAMACGAVISIVVPLLGALPSAVASVRVPLAEALRDTA